MSLNEIIAKEGDRKEWEYKGYKCLIKRSPNSGALCGYVGLPKDHKFYNKGYDDIIDLDVHGGLTFAGFWEDQNDGLWYVGFDCAHAGDVTPLFPTLTGMLTNLLEDPRMDMTYKDMEYVTKECESLVDQLDRA